MAGRQTEERRVGGECRGGRKPDVEKAEGTIDEGRLVCGDQTAVAETDRSQV